MADEDAFLKDLKEITIVGSGSGRSYKFPFDPAREIDEQTLAYTSAVGRLEAGIERAPTSTEERAERGRQVGTMVGGLAGGIAGVAAAKFGGAGQKLKGLPAASAGEAIGGIIGSAAGAGIGSLSAEQLANGLQAAGIIGNERPMVSLDESSRTALNETLLDLATGTSITMLPIAGKLVARRALGLVGPEPMSAAKLALRYNLALGAQNIATSTVTRSYNNVIGRMPLFAAASRRAATGIEATLPRRVAVALGVPGVARPTQGTVASIAEAEKGFSHLIGPSMSLADLGITFRNASRASYELFERRADRLYKGAHDQAIESGAQIPNDQLRLEAKAIHNQLTDLPRRTVREELSSTGTQVTTRDPVLKGDPSTLVTRGTRETTTPGKLPVREESTRVSEFDPDSATRTVDTERRRVREGTVPISPDADSKVLQLVNQLQTIEDASGAIPHQNMLKRIRSLMEDHRDNPSMLKVLARLREASVRDRGNIIGPQSVRDAYTAAEEFYTVGNRMFENPTAAKFQSIEEDVFKRRIRGGTDLQLGEMFRTGQQLPGGDEITRRGKKPVEMLFEELFHPQGEIGLTESMVGDLHNLIGAENFSKGLRSYYDSVRDKFTESLPLSTGQKIPVTEWKSVRETLGVDRPDTVKGRAFQTALRASGNDLPIAKVKEFFDAMELASVNLPPPDPAAMAARAAVLRSTQGGSRGALGAFVAGLGVQGALAGGGSALGGSAGAIASLAPFLAMRRFGRLLVDRDAMLNMTLALTPSVLVHQRRLALARAGRLLLAGSDFNEMASLLPGAEEKVRDATGGAVQLDLTDVRELMVRQKQ